MYVKSLKELTIFAFAFNYETLYPFTKFDELSQQTRDQIVQWLLDHDTGILDCAALDERHSKNPHTSESSSLTAENKAHGFFRRNTKTFRSWRIHRKTNTEDVLSSADRFAATDSSFDSDALEEKIEKCFGQTKLFANLTKLNVTKSLLLCDELLQCFADQCAHLRNVSLAYCPYVSDDGISHLIQNEKLNLLESLSIDSCPKITGSSLAQLDTKGNIVSVTLKFQRLNWKAFKMFLLLNCCLRSLDLRSSTFMGHVEEVSEIANILGQNLVCLVMPKTNHRLDLFMSALCTYCPNIRKLDLTACSVEDIDPLHENCAELEELDLTFCVKLNPNYFQPHSMLPIPPSVRVLGLGSVSLNTESLEKLVGTDQDNFCVLANLTHIDLNGVEATAYDTNFLKVLCTCLGHQLQSISLNHPELPEVALSPLANYCTRLENLSISNSQLVSGQALKPLFSGPVASKLKVLSLMRCTKIEPEVLAAISQHCCSLEKLHLNCIEAVADDLVVKISETCSSTLKAIGIGACRQVTDRGVVCLAVNCDLRKINLAGIVNITNTSIIQLARCCPTLTELYISGCSKITNDAVTYIRDQCISRVYISHRNPNVHNINSESALFSAFNLDSGEFVSVSSATGIF